MDYAIIVAGGRGTRMGGKVAKQFRLLGDRPVLMHTLERFADKAIILVLPHDEQQHWHDLCREYRFALPHSIIDGGQNRFGSCRAGINAIPDDANGVVGIHDGVRPFVSNETIGKVYDEARRTGAAIPVLPVTETLRQEQPDGWHNVDRALFRRVQTPQCFDIQLIKRAYRQPYSPAFTDDASVVEALGAKVSMVEGNIENIKLTTPMDLMLGECLIQNSKFKIHNS